MRGFLSSVLMSVGGFAMMAADGPLRFAGALGLLVGLYLMLEADHA